MKNGWRTLTAFIILGVLSAGLLWGMDAVSAHLIRTKRIEQATETFSPIFASATRYDPIDPTDGIREAYRVYKEDDPIGYAVTLGISGYGGEIEVHVGLNANGTKFTGLRIGTHHESEGYGAQITKSAFYDQFTGLVAPASVNGYTGLPSNTADGYEDGTYIAAHPIFSDGWRAFVEVTVEGGKITKVNWDAESETGDRTKKELSKAGEYTMTEDGPKWHEQAATMEQALVEVQDPSKLIVNAETGKTDAYTGVSIKIHEFIQLATEALDSAGGTHEATPIDGITGATVSSKAVIKAANAAYAFVQEAYGQE